MSMITYNKLICLCSNFLSLYLSVFILYFANCEPKGTNCLLLFLVCYNINFGILFLTYTDLFSKPNYTPESKVLFFFSSSFLPVVVVVVLIIDWLIACRNWPTSLDKGSRQKEGHHHLCLLERRSPQWRHHAEVGYNLFMKTFGVLGCCALFWGRLCFTLLCIIFWKTLCFRLLYIKSFSQKFKCSSLDSRVLCVFVASVKSHEVLLQNV